MDNSKDQMPKDFLADFMEQENEKWYLDMYQVHKEIAEKSGTSILSFEEYKAWLTRKRTPEELQQEEEEQDKWDTYLRHNGPIGSRKKE